MKLAAEHLRVLYEALIEREAEMAALTFTLRAVKKSGALEPGTIDATLVAARNHPELLAVSQQQREFVEGLLQRLAHADTSAEDELLRWLRNWKSTGPIN
jgi:hypothetical protein